MSITFASHAASKLQGGLPASSGTRQFAQELFDKLPGKSGSNGRPPLAVPSQRMQDAAARAFVRQNAQYALLEEEDEEDAAPVLPAPTTAALPKKREKKLRKDRAGDALHGKACSDLTWLVLHKHQSQLPAYLDPKQTEKATSMLSYTKGAYCLGYWQQPYGILQDLQPQHPACQVCDIAKLHSCYSQQFCLGFCVQFCLNLLCLISTKQTDARQQWMRFDHLMQEPTLADCMQSPKVLPSTAANLSLHHIARIATCS